MSGIKRVVKTKARNGVESTRVVSIKTDLERLVGKINIPDGISFGCWIWGGARGGGYGQLRYSKRTERAHRVSYVFFKGDIPQGKIVCHRCGNRLCVNPSHLYAGTPAQNTADAKRHGVLGKLKGSDIGNSKLTEKEVNEIRVLLSGGEAGVSLAKAYGVTPASISSIKNRKCWRHI